MPKALKVIEDNLTWPDRMKGYPAIVLYLKIVLVKRSNRE